MSQRKKTRKQTIAPRGVHLDVRLTESQKATIERVALAVGLDPSTWLRMVGLKESGWQPTEEDAYGEEKSGGRKEKT